MARSHHTPEQVNLMREIGFAREEYEAALERLAEAAWQAQASGLPRYQVRAATGLAERLFTTAFSDRVWEHINNQDYLKPEYEGERY
jgi:hypothetical protein